MDILLIQSQKNGLTTSLFIEDFSIINHWSNHPLIVQDGSAKSEMSQLITHPQNVHGLGNHFPKFTSVSKYRCLWTPALARLNFF
jgi:hypothetical protein